MLGSLAAVAASAAVPPGTEDAPRHEQRLRDAVGQQQKPASEGERPTEAAASQAVWTVTASRSGAINVS